MTHSTATPATAEARLLVVDDEPHVRSALASAFTMLGYDVEEAGSGHQALEMLAHSHYDLMILDIRMPGMDGVEVMRHAKTAHPDLLIVILTGHATLDSAITAVRAGAVDYLLKPCSNREIVAIVSLALRSRRKELHQQQSLRAIVDMAAGALQVTEEQDPPPAPERPPRFLRRGPITLDREGRTVTIVEADGSEALQVELTAREAALLACLLQHAERVLSCRELVQAAFGLHRDEQEARAIVRPHICRLRKKLEVGPFGPQLIRNVRSRGYLFSCS